MSLRLACARQLLAPLVKKLKKGDTVYIHNRPEFALALISICRSRGARVVLHMQNSHLMGWSRLGNQALNVDALVFCSAFLKGEAVRYAAQAHRVAVIPNGADDSMFYPERRSKADRDHVPVILFASRLVPSKGPHVFLEAMRLLGERMIQAKGVIVGASKFGGSSKATGFIKKLHRMAPQNVAFHDYCSGKALAELFRGADIFCLPSVFDDPFPLTSLEAMASKLPVVATHSGGIPEAFAEGGAILVQRDSPFELAAALERLVSEAPLRAKMAEEGYASFRKNFTWPSIRERYLGMMDALST